MEGRKVGGTWKLLRYRSPRPSKLSIHGMYFNRCVLAKILGYILQIEGRWPALQDFLERLVKIYNVNEKIHFFTTSSVKASENPTQVMPRIWHGFLLFLFLNTCH